ncbi:hypothetical protein HYQ46_001787 [Verticillium longisporum]|nr:hypothetical protein HYQ46_001787 [Verticillium longisporum]
MIEEGTARDKREWKWCAQGEGARQGRTKKGINGAWICLAADHDAFPLTGLAGGQLARGQPAGLLASWPALSRPRQMGIGDDFIRLV